METWLIIGLVPSGMMIVMTMATVAVVVFQRLRFLTTGYFNHLGELESMSEILRTAI